MDDLFSRLLELFAALGLWKDGLELIGSWSFLLYQRHLGVRPLPLRTQDVDFLLPWPYRGAKEVDLSSALAGLGFLPVTTAGGSMYFAHPELKVEFLVPERGRGGLDCRLVKALGVRAVPLRFLDMLLKDPIRLVEGGVAVRVPKPLNYCPHKLIVAQRRKDAAKREKDVQHAVWTMDILKPADFKAELARLSPKWRRLAGKSLAQAWRDLPLERPRLARFMDEPEAGG